MLREGSGQAYMHANAVHEEMNVEVAPETRFPIPNETRMRTSKNTSRQHKTRVVQYQGDGSAVGTPTDLPFAPPGLMWRGHPAITSSQLTSQLDAIIALTIRIGRGRGH